LKNFRSGVTSTALLKAQEYPALVVAFMVCLGTKDAYFSEEETENIQNALTGLTLCWYVLKRTWYDRKEIEKLPDLVHRYVKPQTLPKKALLPANRSHSYVLLRIINHCGSYMSVMWRS